MRQGQYGAIALGMVIGIAVSPVLAQTSAPPVGDRSAVLRRWSQGVPDLGAEIENEPSLPTRWRLGYGQFPSTNHATGVILGVEDLYLGGRWAIRGDLQMGFDNRRTGLGADLLYYLRPLGHYVNVSPLVGYRHIRTGSWATGGVNVGAQAVLALSRGGAADLTLRQSFVSPGAGDREVGIGTLGVGYGITPRQRLAVEFQWERSTVKKDSRVGLFWEWNP